MEAQKMLSAALILKWRARVAKIERVGPMMITDSLEALGRWMMTRRL
jgi:hypothetical protein